jgi:hypothetical protein
MKRIAIFLTALFLTACASMDAAHIEGQKQDAAKFREYTDVQYQQAVAVQQCFQKATTDNQMAYCALLGTSTGMASTFGGRPTTTTIAPTTLQTIGRTVEKIAPVAGIASVVRNATAVSAQQPLIVEQPAPLIVRPEIITIP